MTLRTILYLATFGVVLLSCTLPGCGCSGKNAPPKTQEEFERYFSKESPVPKDLSVKINVLPVRPYHRVGDTVELNMSFTNMAKRARRLPIGHQTDEGFVYTFLSALVRKDGGPVEQVTIPPAEGELVSLDLGKYDSGNYEPLVLSDYYNFDEPGQYEIVLFYTVDAGPLSDGSGPEWTGTVWSALIGVLIE